ncbi:MAG: response regulator [Dehalococcoidia bacterium]|nr:response regulator [Dehalococcoidia bacterium]
MNAAGFTTPSPLGRLWRVDWRALGLPLALGFVQVVGTTFAAQDQADRTSMDGLAYLLLLAGPAALVVRQRWPVAVVWAVITATLLYLLLEYPYGPFVFSPVVALFTAVTAGHRLAAWLSAAALYGVHFGYRLASGDEPAPTWEQALGVAAWLVLVLVVSEVARIRGEQAAEAARIQREEERRRASEERLRIARDLHDVLAHHISLMNVQAGVALHLMDQRPEQARTALTAIEEASREAIGELRSVLNILQGPDEHAPRSPAPSVARLEGLVSRARAAGLDVRTMVEGATRTLPSAVDAAAFRVIQEALTNVVRHAGARTATVLVSYGDDSLTVQVDDDGEGARRTRSEGGGSGIPGMREGARCRQPAGPWLSRPRPAPVRGRPVIRVLLADDQTLVRAGFRALLDAEDDIEVVGEAGNGEEAVALVGRLQPDVVLMDIRMPGLDGLVATERITGDEKLREVKVVILTTFDLDEYVFEALRLGASGFLVKDTRPAELVQAVRVVAGGDALLSPGVTRRLIERFAHGAKRPRLPADVERLTEREREVVALVGEGLSNEEIAERLVLSPWTAKTHVSRAMIKLDARDRAQLVVVAYESGLIQPGWTS